MDRQICGTPEPAFRLLTPESIDSVPIRQVDQLGRDSRAFDGK
jgi:hypothetical protein